MLTSDASIYARAANLRSGCGLNTQTRTLVPSAGGTPPVVFIEQQVNAGCIDGSPALHCRNQSVMRKGAKMDLVRETLRVAGRTVDASIAAAGAVGGATVNGVVGGVQGAVDGVRSGLRSGSRSIPAAALTMAAVGAAGLVEWPVLLPFGATVLAVHYLAHRPGGGRRRAPTPRVGSRSAAKGRSGSRASTAHTAARSRPARSAQH